MEAKWIHKIIGVGTSLGVVLPPRLLNSLGIRKGDTIVIYASDATGIKLTRLQDYLEERKGNKQAITKLQ